MPAFSLVFLQDHAGTLHFVLIVLLLDAESDLAFLETVQNVRFRYRMNAVIANAPDHRPLFYFKHHNFTIGAFGRVFDVQLYIFKKLRVPKRLEISAQRLFIVRIAIAAENSGF